MIAVDRRDASAPSTCRTRKTAEAEARLAQRSSAAGCAMEPMTDRPRAVAIGEAAPQHAGDADRHGRDRVREGGGAARPAELLAIGFRNSDRLDSAPRFRATSTVPTTSMIRIPRFGWSG